MERMTADQVAALFMERMGDGNDTRLTRKQTGWLMGQWERETRPPTEQRRAVGNVYDGSGGIAGYWVLDVLRNGAGILRRRELPAIPAPIEPTDADRQQLADIDHWIADHADDPNLGLYQNMRADFARDHGLVEAGA